MNVNQQVGLRIATVRDAVGMTQVQLSKASGVERTQIAMIESGRSGCTIINLLRLAAALKCKPARLLPSSGGGCP